MGALELVQMMHAILYDYCCLFSIYCKDSLGQDLLSYFILIGMLYAQIQNQKKSPNDSVQLSVFLLKISQVGLEVEEYNCVINEMMIPWLNL